MQIVKTLVWTGGESYGLIYGEVVRVNRKTITVRWLHSDCIQRCKPENVELCSAQEAQYGLETKGD